MSQFFNNQTLEVQIEAHAKKVLHRVAVVGLSESEITIQALDNSGSLFQTPIGTPVNVYFIRPDALYSMPSEILDKLLKPSPAVVLARDDEKIQRLQRRRFFRVEVRVNSEIIHLQAPARSGGSRIEKTVTRNLSAGGALCALRHLCQIGDQVEMHLELPPGNVPVEALARVVRVQRRVGKAQASQLVGLSFEEMRQSHQSRLTQFLFRLQGRSRR